MTVHFVEIIRWSTHDIMNYSDAPAKLDELRASHGFLASVENTQAELVPSPHSRRWSGKILNLSYCVQNYSHFGECNMQQIQSLTSASLPNYYLITAIRLSFIRLLEQQLVPLHAWN